MADQPGDHAATARAIVDGNLYLTLATADAGGRPWATPVYFAAIDHREFVWVSRPEARHSQNLSVRAEVGIVVFDSRAPLNTGRGVYMAADAGLATGADLDRAVAAFSRSSLDRGGAAWTHDDVGPGSHLRMYRAVATEQWVLDDRDRRVALPLGLGAPGPAR